MAKPAKKLHSSCTCLRCKVIKHGTMQWGSNAPAKYSHSEVVTEPCGTPLFADDERKTGICRACRDGWEHKENYSVDPRFPSKLHPQPEGK